MGYCVYVLVRGSDQRTYVGYTKEDTLERRLRLHNTGKGAEATRQGTWTLLVWITGFARQRSALEFEGIVHRPWISLPGTGHRLSSSARNSALPKRLSVLMMACADCGISAEQLHVNDRLSEQAQSLLLNILGGVITVTDD